MLLGGDEMGRTQRGNNNAYCQDNEISWLDWKLDDRRRGLLEFTRRMIALRQRPPGAAEQPRFLVGDLMWDSQSRTSPGCGPTAKRWIAGGLAEALDRVARAHAGRRRHPHDSTKPGSAMVGDGLLAAHERAPRADHLPVARRGGGPGGCSKSTPPILGEAGGTPVPVEYEVGARARWLMFRQPLDRDLAREAATAPARIARARDAAAAPARRSGAFRCSRSAPPLGWGLGEIADIPRFADWAGQAGFSVLQLLPVNEVPAAMPARTPRCRRSRSIRSICRWTAARTSSRPGGARRSRPGSRRRAGGLASAPLVDWKRCGRLKRAGIALGFARFKREEWAKDTVACAAAGRVHQGEPRLARRLCALQRVA